MNLRETIESFDNQKANTVSLETKIKWLSQLDYKIFSDILSDRIGGEFLGYNAQTSLETSLLAPEEYGDIYILYLNMKTDYKNGEIGRYNNSAMLYNRAYMEMSDFINRKNAVKKKTKIKAGDIYV